MRFIIAHLEVKRILRSIKQRKIRFEFFISVLFVELHLFVQFMIVFLQACLVGRDTEARIQSNDGFYTETQMHNLL